jgi:hypothetical protein
MLDVTVKYLSTTSFDVLMPPSGPYLLRMRSEIEDFSSMNINVLTHRLSELKCIPYTGNNGFIVARVPDWAGPVSDRSEANCQKSTI